MSLPPELMGATERIAQLEERIRELEAKCGDAMTLIEQYAVTAGANHKQWILDQISRVLVGDAYDVWVATCRYGDDGPDTWDEEVAP